MANKQAQTQAQAQAQTTVNESYALRPPRMGEEKIRVSWRVPSLFKDNECTAEVSQGHARWLRLGASAQAKSPTKLHKLYMDWNIPQVQGRLTRTLKQRNKRVPPVITPSHQAQIGRCIHLYECVQSTQYLLSPYQHRRMDYSYEAISSRRAPVLCPLDKMSLQSNNLSSRPPTLAKTVIYSRLAVAR
ncbi:hypothetical protein M431DRAFT_529487 [Trichoderma harzianum CBS 226.95]|uniref:Uncharacterized protein n=1 Tax=Trichoderma harzianum CBS 226.95 TaxID=983964 RepID=A0A2T4AHW3_TRIHA|nr:hypothetical protein M431DRAFT_529487 [Trichoderma harzianum CBS 226.95]PTB56680.1 hypothetical protein M431DRAFT_529487 [Trichoderma harzianum CBS 226.95]